MDDAAKKPIHTAELSLASLNPAVTPAAFTLRVGLFFAALFLVYGVHMMYFPVWLASRGMTPEQIGLIIAVPIVIRAVLTPYVALQADLRSTHRDVIFGLASASALIAIGIASIPGQGAAAYPLIVATAIPFAVMMTSILPLIDTIALQGARNEPPQESGAQSSGRGYGRMRLWGSLSFLAATLAAGIGYDLVGPNAIMWGLIGAAFTTAAAALLLPPSRQDGPATAAPVPLAMAPTGGPPIVRTLLKSPLFLVFMLAVGAIQASHSCFYTFGALHLEKQGVSGTGYGALWVVAILAETALFAGSATMMGRTGPIMLLVVGGCAATLRWVVMAFDPPYVGVFALQLLHALSFGATHLGAVHFISKAVPGRGAGTAQALYATVGNGLALAGSTYLAGQFYPVLAGGTYLLMGGLAIAGTVAAVHVMRRWRGEAII